MAKAAGWGIDRDEWRRGNRTILKMVIDSGNLQTAANRQLGIATKSRE